MCSRTWEEQGPVDCAQGGRDLVLGLLCLDNMIPTPPAPTAPGQGGVMGPSSHAQGSGPRGGLTGEEGGEGLREQVPALSHPEQCPPGPNRARAPQPGQVVGDGGQEGRLGQVPG